MCRDRRRNPWWNASIERAGKSYIAIRRFTAQKNGSLGKMSKESNKRLFLQAKTSQQQEIGPWWKLITQKQLITQRTQLNCHLIAFFHWGKWSRNWQESSGLDCTRIKPQGEQGLEGGCDDTHHDHWWVYTAARSSVCNRAGDPGATSDACGGDSLRVPFKGDVQ